MLTGLVGKWRSNQRLAILTWIRHVVLRPLFLQDQVSSVGIAEAVCPHGDARTYTWVVQQPVGSRVASGSRRRRSSGVDFRVTRAHCIGPPAVLARPTSPPSSPAHGEGKRALFHKWTAARRFVCASRGGARNRGTGQPRLRRCGGAATDSWV